MGMANSVETTIDALLHQYDALFLDAFGVLVDKQGALPGAKALIDALNQSDKPYLILTNSASRLPETMARDFHARGLSIDVPQILSSGMLLNSYFEEHAHNGKSCVVLGPDDSVAYAEQAGAEVVCLSETMDAEVVVIADQKGFDCIEGMDWTLSMIMRRLDAGKRVELILCNPDIIYPIGPGHYGFTSGGLAAMLEAVLEERYPEADYRFKRLGKPYAPIFQQAVKITESSNPLMIGDQLATDILGANRFGIDSALVGSGLARGKMGNNSAKPTWYLPSLEVSE